MAAAAPIAVAASGAAAPAAGGFNHFANNPALAGLKSYIESESNTKMMPQHFNRTFQKSA
jgi:hypothetical protein